MRLIQDVGREKILQIYLNEEIKLMEFSCSLCYLKPSEKKRFSVVYNLPNVSGICSVIEKTFYHLLALG